VGDTRRQGLEVSVSQRVARLTWSVEYSFIDATFQDDFIVNSPNHPLFEADDDDPGIVGDGKLLVRTGSTIPAIPEHQDPRFLGAGPPLGAWVGVRATL
jgi:iron complex outermembrane recepter protein